MTQLSQYYLQGTYIYAYWKLASYSLYIRMLYTYPYRCKTYVVLCTTLSTQDSIVYVHVTQSLRNSVYVYVCTYMIRSKNTF